MSTTNPFAKFTTPEATQDSENPFAQFTTPEPEPVEAKSRWEIEDEPVVEPVAEAIPEKSISENIGTVVDKGNIRNAQAAGGLMQAAADAGNGEYDYSLMGDETHYPLWSLQGASQYVGDVAKKIGGDIVGLGVDAADEIISRINNYDHWYVQWYAYKALKRLGWTQKK